MSICKNCNKGLCHECLTEIENGIACTATCIDEVKLVNSLINRNKDSYKTASSAHQRNAYIYVSIGLVFLVWGYLLDGFFGFLTIMGVIFVIGAIFSFNNANKYKKGSVVDSNEV
ncbi:hypothetical protein [Carboxylicivirga marina]|uniref:B box-type domain-containing protein n=1 Tax=Carboxylicivirga marina TaxID=2800988 RepID=A0ABS1HLE2_9BACT|nr:hypothetical protein [Carboxylicivirga marina]MBK3518481.1 hypothetical protein [Carboxylicivirga marina]